MPNQPLRLPGRQQMRKRNESSLNGPAQSADYYELHRQMSHTRLQRLGLQPAFMSQGRIRHFGPDISTWGTNNDLWIEVIFEYAGPIVKCSRLYMLPTRSHIRICVNSRSHALVRLFNPLTQMHTASRKQILACPLHLYVFGTAL